MAAIYMWRKENGTVIVFTTMLYPLDVDESIEMSAAPVDETTWMDVVEDAIQGGLLPRDGALLEIRFDAPEQGPEEIQGGLLPLEGDLFVVRFDALEEGPEEIQGGLLPEDGTLIGKKVQADSPPEELEITCSIESDSSMTPV